MSFYEDMVQSVRKHNSTRATFLEQMLAKDRQRAMQKAHEDPGHLSDYERRLIDYVDPEPVSMRREPDLDTDVIRPSWLIFRSAELNALNEHAIDIARRYGLNTKNCQHGKQRANKAARTILTPAVSNAETYAVFLHEAGHIVSPDGDATQYRYEVVQGSEYPLTASPGGEVGAWLWAVENACTGRARCMSAWFRAFRATSIAQISTNGIRWHRPLQRRR
jgi:hypothetical protein